MRTAIIVQARIASTRLPGKTMQKIGGHTVIAHVLHRCRSVVGADVVVCAIPESEECDELAAEALRCGAVVSRGSESDVLDRYLRAAQQVDADVVMRVTSDCPLIDPGLCGALLRLRSETDADYASNNMPPSWAHGLDCEAFTMQALERAAHQAVLPLEREHVTPWLRAHPRLERVNLADPEAKSVQYRWTLDFPEDLAFFRALAELLPVWPAIASIEEVLNLLEAHPTVVAINAARRDLTRTPNAQAKV